MTKRILLIAVFCLFSSGALAKTCEVSIEGNDAMQYNKSEIKVGADCTEVKLTLSHSGALPKETMGHGWMVTKTADMTEVGNAAIAAGIESEHIPDSDKILATVPNLVGGGESVTVTFSMDAFEAGGDYTFFCPFPGHSAVMKGKFVVG